MIWSSKALLSASTFSPNCKDNLDNSVSIFRNFSLSSLFKLAPFLEKPLYCFSSNIVCSGSKFRTSLVLYTDFTFTNSAEFKIISFLNSLSQGEISWAIFWIASEVSAEFKLKKILVILPSFCPVSSSASVVFLKLGASGFDMIVSISCLQISIAFLMAGL